MYGSSNTWVYRRNILLLVLKDSIAIKGCSDLKDC